MFKTVSAFACLAITAAGLALFGGDTPSAALVLSAALCAAALIATFAPSPLRHAPTLQAGRRCGWPLSGRGRRCAAPS
jgi:hypothetical protein